MFDDEIGTLIFECRGCKDICFAVDDNTSTIINTSTCLQCRIEQKLPNKRMRLDPTPLVQPLEPLLLLPPAAHLLKSRSEPEDADKIASNQFIFPFRKNLSQLGPADFVGRFCHYYPSVIGDESVLNYLADCGRLWRVTPECIKIKSRSYNVGVSFFSCASKMPYVIKAEIIPNRGWCDEIQTAASYASKLFEAERIDRSEFDSALVFHYRQRKNGSPWLKILEAKRSMVVMLCIGNPRTVSFRHSTSGVGSGCVKTTSGGAVVLLPGFFESYSFQTAAYSKKDDDRAEFVFFKR